MHFVEKYKKHLKHTSTIIFLFGFITDMVLLPDVSNPITKYLGLAYIVAIGILIAFREWVIARNKANKTEQKIFSITSFCIAYFSGAALSFVFVYALRSAALSVSWPLFLILILCMVANELFSTHTYRFMVDIMVLFVALVFYVIFNAPFIVNTQNDTVFLISVISACVIACIYIATISRVSETSEKETPKMYALGIGVPMFIAMLYFLNMIPSVPLSLTHGNVYHELRKQDDGSYIVTEEKQERFFSFIKKPTFSLEHEGDIVYFLSSVRAPSQMKAPISHVWEYYDKEKNKWVENTTISFVMSGGRDSGYRAYSYKENIFEGEWRITVKVDNKRVVGRFVFDVEKSVAKPMTTKVLQ